MSLERGRMAVTSITGPLTGLTDLAHGRPTRPSRPMALPADRSLWPGMPVGAIATPSRLPLNFKPSRAASATGATDSAPTPTSEGSCCG